MEILGSSDRVGEGGKSIECDTKILDNTIMKNWFDLKVRWTLID